MVYSKCTICKTPITESNDTKEHVIPNSIGGIKKVKGFICNTCNKESGTAWDMYVSKQLNPLCLFFRINIDRGKVQSESFESDTGKNIILHHDGRMSHELPIYKEEKTESGLNIHIRARNIKEARRMLKGAKKKYPKIDYEGSLAKIEDKSNYSKKLLKFNLSVGGHEFGRSIVKTALALAYDLGVDTSLCSNTINYFESLEKDAPFDYFYEKDLIINRPKGMPLHCVSISSNPDSKLLIGYVEYFGIYRMIICLSSNYEGKFVRGSYSINPITGELLDLEISLDFSRSELNSIINHGKEYTDSLINCYKEVIEYGMTKSFENDRNKLVTDALKDAFQKLNKKENEKLNDEDLKFLNRYILKKLEPFIMTQVLKNS